MRAAIAAIASASLLAIPGSAWAAPKPQPVMIGGNDDLDACLSTGEVRGLNPNGDGFLSVRAAPTAKAAERDRVRNGQSLWLCDESADGSWIGVVYATDDTDCGVGTPRTRAIYRGPCKSGWVARRYVLHVAG